MKKWRLNSFFFFSSRRRHTRWNCDWSSDVCSSDLGRELASIRYKSYDSSQCHYGIGIVGSGARPQIAAGHGGSGGVGIRKSFPWVAAVPPVMHPPVNVLISGYGVVKPSVSV